MTCRESLSLDLADFPAHASAPEFAAFRGHYPRCADCSAEVRVWTDLHAALSASAHPSPDTLLRYQDASLADADRRSVGRHLDACAPCRDELRALGVFDREAARASRPAVAEERPWLRMPEWTRFVLHPALAYGLVLVLLFYPALTRRQWAPEPRLADRIGAAEETSQDRPAARSRADRAAPAEQQRGGDARLADRFREPARAAGSVAAVPEPPQQAGKQRAVETPPPAAPAASARAKAETRDRESDAAAPARLGATAQLAAPGSGLLLGKNATPRLDADLVDDPVVLRVPVPAAWQALGPLEVRVADERRVRELRERVAATGDLLEMRVPRLWLTPGVYHVEVWAPGAAEPDVFAFTVDG